MTSSPKGYSNKFEHGIWNTICDHGMFRPGDAVLVGVSGGSDSVALLHVLHRLAPRLSLKLAIAHLNHGLRRPESDQEAGFVRTLAKSLNLPFYLQTLDVKSYQRQKGLSPEDAARRVRYAFYLQTARKAACHKIALGHQADDNAELVLMRLIRGAGPLGMSGIPPIRDADSPDIQIVRPLIRATKSQITEYLRAQELTHVTDSSNTDTDFLRNRVRHQLLPLLKDAYNPNIAATLNRLAAILRGEEKWAHNIAAQLYEDTVAEKAPARVALFTNKLKAAMAAAQRRIIRMAVAKVKGDLLRVSYEHIDAVQGLLAERAVNKRIDLPNGIQVIRNPDTLIFQKAPAADTEAGVFEYEIEPPGSVLVKEAGRRINLYLLDIADCPDFRQAGSGVAFFDMAKLSFPLKLRNIRPGDRFTPLGMIGSQKVKRYFIHHKIPSAQRKNCPVLVSQGRIIWVVGHRIAEFAKVCAQTRNVLQAELLLA